MKKNFKKYLSVLLAAVMVFSALTLVACTPDGFGKETDTQADQNMHGLSLKTKSSPFLSLSASTTTRASTNGNMPEHVLTATVLPEDAENREVDWSVAWEDTSRQETVSEYIRLITNGDGGNVATVTCLQPFTGNIVITVTTREGGFTARCLCKYMGLPSAMEVDLSDATIVTDTDWNVGVMEIDSGNVTTYHEINLSNIFGKPTAEFTPEYDIVLEAHGGIYTKNSTYDANGNLLSTERGELALRTEDFMDIMHYCSAYFSGFGIVNCLYVGLRDGQLYISGPSYPASFSTEKKNSDGTVTKAVFDGYIDDMEPYVTVTLTETVTGITYTFNVRTVGLVNDVNLDHGEIVF